MGIATSCVSYRQPFGNRGRIGRSIRRAVSVAFSPARPSRLKNEPGIFPAAYILSSTSTVRGRKSTSLRFPAVAVQRTIVSPDRTTTAPEACLASLPVSNEISSPAISTGTRVTASDIFIFSFLLRRSVGGGLLVFFFSCPNVVRVAGARVGGDRLAHLRGARAVERPDLDPAGMHPPAREHGRGRDDASADARFDVALHPRAGGLGAQ